MAEIFTLGFSSTIQALVIVQLQHQVKTFLEVCIRIYTWFCYI